MQSASSTKRRVLLCPACRTSNRRPVAPGRSLCQPHLDSKRANQNFRRQQAKMRRDAEKALGKQNNNACPGSHAPTSTPGQFTQQLIPGPPAVQSSEQGWNRQPANAIMARTPVYEAQDFRTYMQRRTHGLPASPAQRVPFTQVAHPVSNPVHLQQGMVGLLHPTMHSPATPPQNSTASWVEPWSPPRGTRVNATEDSGYHTATLGLHFPQHYTAGTPASNSLPPEVRWVDPEPAYPGQFATSLTYWFTNQMLPVSEPGHSDPVQQNPENARPSAEPGVDAGHSMVTTRPRS